MWTDSASGTDLDLGSNERLVWSGQPRGGIRLRSSDAFAIPFSLFWCGFVIFWEYSVLTGSAKRPGPPDVISPIMGVLFLAVGFYLVVGRFIADAYVRGRTTYAVTTERLIIVSGFFSRQTKSLNLRTLSDITLNERSDGSGTITFGPSPVGPNRWFAQSSSWPGAGRYAPPAFEMIESAKEVYDLIRQTQKTAG
jgi:hypothetical protein